MESEFVFIRLSDLKLLLPKLLEEALDNKGIITDTVEGEKPMNQRETTLFLGITEPTIIKWRKQNRLPFHQIPGTNIIRYYKSELLKAVQNTPGLIPASRK